MVLLALGLAGFPMFLTPLGIRRARPQATVVPTTTAQGGGYLPMGIGPLGVGVPHELTGDCTGMFALAATVLGVLVSGWLATRPHVVNGEVPVRPRFPAAPTSPRWPGGTR